MSSVSGVAGFNLYALQQYQQSLFSQIGADGDGSIAESGLQQDLTTTGGTTQTSDTLYSELGTGQQSAQGVLGSPFSDEMQAQMLGYQAQGWPDATGGSSNSASADPASMLAQNLFSEIDSNGDGSISKTELEQAVTAAGGTTQSADALYAQLDPDNTGSVSEQQFADGLGQLLPPPPEPPGLTAAAGGDATQNTFGSATDGSDNGTAGTSPAQFAQNLFAQIDSNGDGSISKTELEQAVTAAGGTTQAADALYAQLDPDNTGSVSEQQFADALQPPSASGTTAQDALFALLAPSTQTTAMSSASGSSTGATAGDSTVGDSAEAAIAALLENLNSTNSTTTAGSSAQSAMLALLDNLDSSSGASASASASASTTGGTSTSTSGSTAQDALLALLQAANGNASNDGSGSSTTGTANVSDLALANSLYQAQLYQQQFGTIFGLDGVGV